MDKSSVRLPNSRDWVVNYFASTKPGVVVVPIDFMAFDAVRKW